MSDLVRNTKGRFYHHAAHIEEHYGTCTCSALDDLEGRLQDDDPELKKQVKETQYIRKKAQEYRSQVHKTQASLDKAGVDPSVYHQALVSRAEVRNITETSPYKSNLKFCP